MTVAATATTAAAVSIAASKPSARTHEHLRPVEYFRRLCRPTPSPRHRARLPIDAPRLPGWPRRRGARRHGDEWSHAGWRKDGWPRNPEDEKPGDQPDKAQLLRGHAGPARPAQASTRPGEHRSGSLSVGKGSRSMAAMSNSGSGSREDWSQRIACIRAKARTGRFSTNNHRQSPAPGCPLR